MKNGILGASFSLTVCLLVSSAPLARADSAYIYWDSDYGFSSDVVVNPGDTVYWVDDDIYDFPVLIMSDVSSGPNHFSFSLPGEGYGASFVFNSSGNFGFHSNYGDYGTVVVNFPPSVTITNPLNNAVFSAPATFTISASASDSDADGVSNVKFYVGPNLVGNASSPPPYSVSVTNLAVGTYTLTAIATDNYSGRATNSITITVGNPPAVKLDTPRVAGGQFLFNITGLTAGKTNIVQASTRLTNWTSIATNVATDSSATLTNATGPGAQLYRVIQLP